jgi:hypothetical protein
MALVPRVRDFQVSAPVWVGATSGRPAAAPVRGARQRVKNVRVGTAKVRQLMMDCAERVWLHEALSLSSLTSGLVTPLNDLAQGTANAQRLGNQTRFVELEYAGYFSTVTTSGAEVVRFVIFKDTQPEGALPTVAELLCTGSTTSCFNPDLVGNQSRPRFVVLANRLETYVNRTPFSAAGTTFLSKPFCGRITLDMTTTYEGNAGTYADIQTNGLYLLVYAGQSTTDFVGDVCLKYLRM